MRDTEKRLQILTKQFPRTMPIAQGPIAQGPIAQGEVNRPRRMNARRDRQKAKRREALDGLGWLELII